VNIRLWKELWTGLTDGLFRFLFDVHTNRTPPLCFKRLGTFAREETPAATTTTTTTMDYCLLFFNFKVFKTHHYRHPWYFIFSIAYLPFHLLLIKVTFSIAYVYIEGFSRWRITSIWSKVFLFHLRGCLLFKTNYLLSLTK